MDMGMTTTPKDLAELAVTVPMLNVRQHPTTTSDVLFKVTEGTRLYKLDEQGEFYKVRTQVGEIRSGYVMRKYVREI